MGTSARAESKTEFGKIRIINGRQHLMRPYSLRPCHRHTAYSLFRPQLPSIHSSVDRRCLSLPCHLTHQHRTLADSVRFSPVWDRVSQPYLPAFPLASKFKLLSYTSRSGLQPGRIGPTIPSADFCRFIPPPHDGGSTRQTDRSPRVIRATFPLMPATYTPAPSVQVSGFKGNCLLTR